MYLDDNNIIIYRLYFPLYSTHKMKIWYKCRAEALKVPSTETLLTDKGEILKELSLRASNQPDLNLVISIAAFIVDLLFLWNI